MPADPTPHGASASGAGASGAGSSGAGSSQVGGADTGYHPERAGGWKSGDAPQRLARTALRDLPWEVGVAKPDPAVVVDGVTRTFGGLTAVSVDHLEVQRGGITGLIGPNGAGKTTLFNLLTGFDQPDTGTWSFNGQSLGKLSPHQVARLGVVRTFQLTKALSRLTVLQNMLLGAQGQRGESFFRALVPGIWRQQEKENTEKAMDLLRRFKLDAKKDDFAGTLSGGQRKLLEMARALMSDPQVVMLDEPMAGVNPALTQSLLGHVKDLREQGMTVIFVEHDMDVVRDISDWVVVMAAGRIIAEGPPEAISQNQAVVDAYLGAHHDAPLTVEEEDQVLAQAEKAIAREEATEGEVLSDESASGDDRPMRNDR
jgi:neutral amino acid transport system ATP-binding protein